MNESWQRLRLIKGYNANFAPNIVIRNHLEHSFHVCNAGMQRALDYDVAEDYVESVEAISFLRNS
jgi:hypothetical protein